MMNNYRQIIILIEFYNNLKISFLVAQKIMNGITRSVMV